MSNTPHDCVPPSDDADQPLEDEHQPDSPDTWEAAEATREAHVWPEHDWQELADYVTRTASPEAAAATQVRLQTDAAFARLAMPILQFWDTPLPGADVDLDTAWAAIERKAEVQRLAQVTASGTPSPTAIAPIAAPPYSHPSSRRHPHNPEPHRSIPHRWAIAALLVLMVGYTTLYIAQRPRESALHEYPAMRASRTILLADGSRVTLAPGATLVTDGGTAPLGSTEVRLVHLEGDGSFVVHANPSHPFIVETHGISAIALGTAFDITTTPDAPAATHTTDSAAVQVHVTTGKVVVQHQTPHGRRETLAVLGPGQHTSIQTFSRDFKVGWAAAAAHKSVAETYLEHQAIQAADSARAAARHERP